MMVNHYLWLGIERMLVSLKRAGLQLIQKLSQTMFTTKNKKSPDDSLCSLMGRN